MKPEDPVLKHKGRRPTRDKISEAVITGSVALVLVIIMYLAHGLPGCGHG